jgi:hypothetical protein
MKVEKKKAYAAPRLVKHGSVTEITLHHKPGHPRGGGGGGYRASLDLGGFA